MTPSNDRKVQFQVAPRALRLFGRELVSNSVVALAELVKNAYDADATYARVRFERLRTRSARIVVEDDGHGMTFADLKNKWMVIGTDEKSSTTHSPRYRRRYVGEKGIGRFAVERLSHRTRLETRTANMSAALGASIDWDDLEGRDGYLHKIDIAVQDVPRWDRQHGTTLTLEGLRDGWAPSEIRELQKELFLLLSPFKRDISFRIHLTVPDFPEFSGELRQEFVDDFDFCLRSRLQANGTRSHVLETYDGRTIDLMTVPGTKPEAWTEQLVCGPVEATTYVFVRGVGLPNRGRRKLSAGQLKRLLDEYGGVRIYRDGFRVKPYGDPDVDWLSLNLRRARAPEFWPSTNTLIGEVTLARDTNVALQDQTNREGIIRNQAYDDLVSFLVQGFDLYVRWRLRQRSARSLLGSGQGNHRKEVSQSLREIRSVTKSLKDRQAARAIEKQLLSITRNNSKFERELISEIQMLRNLASLGIGVGVFGHETESAITTLAKALELVRDDLPPATINTMTMSLDTLRSYSDLITDYLRAPKRELRIVSPNAIVSRVLDRFHHLLDENEIAVRQNLSASVPHLRLRPIDLEAVLINLITNSVHFLGRSPTRSRVIAVETTLKADYVHLLFADSGIGIAPTLGNDVFLPFRTTKEDGTGLGLTIVRDTIESYKGSIDIVSHALGGAAFLIRLPVSKEAK